MEELAEMVVVALSVVIKSVPFPKRIPDADTFVPIKLRPADDIILNPDPEF